MSFKVTITLGEITVLLELPTIDDLIAFTIALTGFQAKIDAAVAEINALTAKLQAANTGLSGAVTSGEKNV
jgi:hypothetical protein